MSICIYTCIFKIYTYLNLYTYIHIYMYTHVCIWFFICMYVYIYLSVYAWIYMNSLITLLCVLQGFLTKHLVRTVIQLLTHSFKNHSVTYWKSRRGMLQIGLLLSEIPWVCLSGRDAHRPFKFVIRAVWNKKIRLCSWRQTKGAHSVSLYIIFYWTLQGAISRFEPRSLGITPRCPASYATETCTRHMTLYLIDVAFITS